MRLSATRHLVPSAILVGSALLITVAAPARAEPVQTSLNHVILMDAETRTVLFERGADDLMTPAATAKIMTADLIFSLIKGGKLRPDQTFTVSETAWRQGGAPSRGSTMFAKLRSQVSVDDLLHGLIVDSANDAAIVLAEGAAGSQGAFATQMIKHARELGLAHLTFTNAWGDANPEQKVTPREMALLADDLIQSYPDLYKIYDQRDFLWNNIKQPNRNPLLGMDIGADGLTTGNIGDSGYALVGSAVQGDERLIVAVYGAASAKERAEEARKILQWGFRAFDTRKLYAASTVVGTAQVYGGESRQVPLVATRDIKVLVARDGSEKLVAKIVYTGPLLAPVPANQDLASLRLYSGDKEVLSVPLRTAVSVPTGSLHKRALDAGLEYVEGLFRKYVLRS